MSKKKNEKKYDLGSKIKFRRQVRRFLGYIAAILLFLTAYMFIITQFHLPDFLHVFSFNPDHYFYKYYPFSLFVPPIVGMILIKIALSTKLIPEYLPCPNPSCKKSVKIYENWLCDYCHHKQEKENLLTTGCTECGRPLEKVYCEHCNERLEL